MALLLSNFKMSKFMSPHKTQFVSPFLKNEELNIYSRLSENFPILPLGCLYSIHTADETLKFRPNNVNK